LIDVTNGRPIFAARYMAWLITVPILLLEAAPLCGVPRTKLSWIALLTNSYIVCAWGAQLAPTVAIKIFWICVSFSTFFLTGYETWDACRGLEDPTFITTIMVLFVIYGEIYLGAEFGLISVFSENVAYGVCDALSKAVFSTYILTARMESIHAEVLQLKRYAEDIVNKSVAPMFVVRCTDGKIIQWNKAMAQVSKAAYTDVIGKDFVTDFLYPSAREKTQAQQFEQILRLEDSELQGLKLVDLRIKGEAQTSGMPSQHVDLLFSINRIQSPEGAVMVCVGQDVTELHSFRMLEERKEQMLAVVSHELRSPLHGIIGIAAAAAKTVNTASQKRQMQLISDCAKRLVDFVVTMVDLSALKKGSCEFKPNKDIVDVRRLLDDVCSILYSASDRYSRPLLRDTVNLRCEYRTASLPTIKSNAHRLSQVFLNIIGNALKFTERGHVRIAAVMRDSGDIVVVCEDTGKGIMPSALDRIFEPFEQEDTTDSRNHAGLGLGLAISREIIRKLGGDITVQSVPSCGSTFYITLPVNHQPAGDRTSVEGECRTPTANLDLVSFVDAPISVKAPKGNFGPPDVTSEMQGKGGDPATPHELQAEEKTFTGTDLGDLQGVKTQRGQTGKASGDPQGVKTVEQSTHLKPHFLVGAIQIIARPVTRLYKGDHVFEYGFELEVGVKKVFIPERSVFTRAFNFFFLLEAGHDGRHFHQHIGHGGTQLIFFIRQQFMKKARTV
jgi:signal transduction histidine kinase